MTAITKIKFKRRELNYLEFKWVVVAHNYNYGYVRTPSVTHVIFHNMTWKVPVVYIILLRKIVHE